MGAGTAGEYADAGRRLDVGVIVPRLDALFAWSARELGLPGLDALLDRSGPVPAYAWDAHDAEVWRSTPTGLARAARRLLPVVTS